ncbi:MAG: hypothetical protein ACFCD0_09085 [Gemmataceae bacterium]
MRPFVVIFAETTFQFDPVWPWASPTFGWPVFFVVIGVLVGLTILTYLVGQRISFSQFATVLSIRLGALVVACLLLVQPSCTSVELSVVPSKVVLLVDSSQSMLNNDEGNGKSRWEAALSLLDSKEIRKKLEQLRDSQQIDFVHYQGAETVEDFAPKGGAFGKRTNMGSWFQKLYRRHSNENNLRGLILLGDGADNGTDPSTLEQAKLWREINSPIHVFAFGEPTTTAKQRDIYFAENQIFTPSSVPVKSRFNVRAVVHAPGFANTRITLRMFIHDGKNKLVGEEEKQITLRRRRDNEVQIGSDAPNQPGEYKITLKIDPHRNEVSQLNNEISTYITATKEGVSVLWVEGKKRIESALVIRLLKRDPRFRIYYTERAKAETPNSETKDWYEFDKRQYDVIVIGDISGSRFSGGKKKVFRQIERMVKNKGTGLFVMGGTESYANSDWKQYKTFTEMLPVDLKDQSPGQIKDNVRVLPTGAGWQHFVLRLADGELQNKGLWKLAFRPLPGMTPIGRVREKAALLTEGQILGTNKTVPVLAYNKYGDGRVVVFGGDTTHIAWLRYTPGDQAANAYRTFWKRMMVWLARQETLQGSVFVKLDSRRLAAPQTNGVGFSVGLRSKSGKVLPDGKFKAHVISPTKIKTDVSITNEQQQHRGFYWKTKEPGEYTVVVRGTGKDIDGREIRGEARARFLVYAEDLENLRAEADHELLRRVASASGGTFSRASKEKLLRLLDELNQQAVAENILTKQEFPNWKQQPSKSFVPQMAALWSSLLMPCYLLFTGLLCLEWFLRRRWKMV